MQRHTAQSPPEQCDGYRHERIVIPNRGGVDAREPNLENQSGERDKEDSNMGNHCFSVGPTATLATFHAQRAAGRQGIRSSSIWLVDEFWTPPPPNTLRPRPERIKALVSSNGSVAALAQKVRHLP